MYMKIGCALIIPFLLVMVFFSGCIGPSSHLPKAEIDINSTSGQSNSFYGLGNDTLERLKNPLAFLHIDSVYVYDFLQETCYRCNEGGNVESEKYVNVNQSAGSWKFIQMRASI